MGVLPWVWWYGFRRHTAYPFGSLTESLTNTMFGFLRAYVLLALWDVRPSLGGYAAADAVTFCFVTQALIGPVQIFGGMELTERIRSGDVAIDLHRPAGLQGWWLAHDLGRAASSLVLRAGPPLLAGALVFPFRWPAPAHLAAFAVAVVLATVVSFGLRYLVAMGMFWLHDDRGLSAVTLVMSLFFSGMILPLVVFPGRLGRIAELLPWAAQIQVPADVFLGRYDGAGLAGALAFQAGWAAVLLGAGALVTRAARRRLVVHGG
ncbi:ABC transporter permease [Actinomadura citrea]|uniref:ABC-2 type transport system permease protein n=1 Tax=Actinomadura citrea TaxID=46158 RepID=A0A7Y9GBX9_9ACTN|nr:ABC-2 family transporter protein [Actinomadura citrea]NYE13638.1 ABC-2 type transport system permease protein [Actinomadura citrea]GGT97436.1 ABC transporter permease [Actinomadura citrea]